MEERVIWITGAGKGIGKAIAQKFTENGCKVIISSRSMNDLKNLAGSLNLKSELCFPYLCDVSDENTVISTAAEISGKFGKIDILINNAGTGIFKSVLDTTAEDFKKQINTNILGTFYCSKAVLPLMMERNTGQIINIVSVSAIKAFTGSGPYGATKAAVLMLSRVLREEVKKYKIKVVSVIPGATGTDIWHPKLLAKYRDVMMKPEDIAKAVFDIADQPDTMITEEIILRPIGGDL